MADLSDIFVASLKKHLEGQAYGTKSRIARAVGITPSHFGDIIAQRMYGTEDKRRTIAAYLGYPGAKYEDFLDIGRCILNNEPIEMPKQAPANAPPDLGLLEQKPQAPPTPHLDPELLYDIFRLLDEFLESNKKRLDLRAKFEVVAQLYEMVMVKEDAEATNSIKMFRLINERLAQIA